MHMPIYQARHDQLAAVILNRCRNRGRPFANACDDVAARRDPAIGQNAIRQHKRAANDTIKRGGGGHGILLRLRNDRRGT